MIIPVIIENSLDEIKKRIDIASKFAKLIQIDITEVASVGSDTYKDVETISNINTKCELELDLMVTNPISYINTKFPNINKVSCYATDEINIAEFINVAKDKGYKVGLGIGPKTNMANIYANIKSLDFVQFYTVIPGAKGRPFENSVINKIADFHHKYPTMPIQTDGANSELTIPDLKTAGVLNFVVGSALFSASNPHDKYIELSNMETNDTNNQINTIMNFPGKEPIKQIAILGGAAWQENEEPYIEAFEVSKALAENGYEVVNGGGPGVMEASTKGAHAGGGRVLAITYYPNKPKRHYEGRAESNDFDTEVKTLDYFDRTKVMLQTTQAHIVFRGSIGTLSEFGMTWVSSWIHEPHNKTIILYGEFWKEFLECIEKNLLIVKGEQNMMKICTKPQEVIDYLKSLS